MPDEKKIKKILKVEKAPSSGLSAFIERPVPSEKEVNNFEKVIGREARHQEIDSNLSEIYRGKDGNLIDVKKMKIKKRQLFLIKFFRSLLILGICGLLAYLGYTYLVKGSNDVSALELNINAPEKVSAGQNFSYKITYHNATAYNLSSVHLEIQYPENFVFNQSSIAPQSGNYGWDLPSLAPGANGELDISGVLINKEDSVNVISANLSYTPANISSQFVKQASASTLMDKLDFSVDLNYTNTAFLNQDNDLTLIFSDIKNNQIGDFDLTFTLPDETNVAIASSTAATSTSLLASTTNAISSSSAPALGTSNFSVTKSGGVSWLISGLNSSTNRQEVAIKYKMMKDVLNKDIIVRLEKRESNGKSYVFWEKTITPEIIKSDLNLSLALNDSKNDQAVNFGQTLNYTLTYSNHGASSFKNVSILAAVNGSLVDWSTLKDSNSGERNGNTIIWTAKEIPALAEIKPGSAEGKINFSLNLSPYSESFLGQDLSLSSYAQYSVDQKQIGKDDNKSNIINSAVNSDLNLSEKILYFDNNNNSVGSGPLPPKVGETTGLHVYWTINNNLHELSGAKVIFNLPSYVSYDEKSTVSIGKIYFDATTHKVIWEIGNLPVSTYQANADFGISFTPTEVQRDKILVLSPGSVVSATDNETKDIITKTVSAKTTKLEDDTMTGINHDGKVE